MKTAGQLMAVLSLLALPAGSSGADAAVVQDAPAARAILREYVAPAELTPKLARQVRSLLADLGGSKWLTRENASRELLRIGAPAAPMLTEARGRADVEVRTRADQILKTLRAMERQKGVVLTRAADVLAAAGDPWVIDALLVLLGRDSLELRYGAEYGLRRLTGRSFAYNAYADPSRRAAAAEKWRAWWKQSRQGFRFRTPGDRPQPSGVIVCDPGAREVRWISLEGKLLWSKAFPAEPYRAQPLVNGNTFIALRVAGKTMATEYGPRGNVLLLKGGVAHLQRLPNGNTLLTGPGGRKIREIERAGRRILWEFDCGGAVAGLERLESGNTLLTVSTGGKVIEISRSGRVVWSHTGLSSPRNAAATPGGNVLVVEEGRRRILEIDRNGKTVWTWPNGAGYPVSARRVDAAHTVVLDRMKGLLLVDRAGKVLKVLSPRRPRDSAPIHLTGPTYQPPRGKKKG